MYMSNTPPKTIDSLHTIRSVDLTRTHIDDEGAVALADALKANTSVTNMNLGGNKIGDEGASALADAIEANTSLTNIDLCENKIGDVGACRRAERKHVGDSHKF
jgi:Ran GTPase-activating protein (RanGAP) involved in mRNA processing and transport